MEPRSTGERIRYCWQFWPAKIRISWIAMSQTLRIQPRFGLSTNWNRKLQDLVGSFKVGPRQSNFVLTNFDQGMIKSECCWLARFRSIPTFLSFSHYFLFINSLDNKQIHHYGNKCAVQDWYLTWSSDTIQIICAHTCTCTRACICRCICVCICICICRCICVYMCNVM